jgi:4-hydroxy-tetrahydrodipicolinate reductase
METVKAIVIGAAGRMGIRILWAIHETSHIYLVGAVDRKDHPFLGRDAGEVAGGPSRGRSAGGGFFRGRNH